MFGPALTLVLALVSSAAIASPAVNNAHKNAVASLNPSSTVLPFHFPESVYENTPYSGAASLSLSKEDEVKTATDYISNKLNLGADDFKVFNSFTDAAGVTHVYGAHMVNGAHISNHQASAHVKNGDHFLLIVLWYSSAPCQRDITVSEAKATVDFEKASAMPLPNWYVEQPDGKIVYAYKFQLRNDPATKGSRCGLMLPLARSSRLLISPTMLRTRAIPFPRRDASEGFSTISDPEIKGSSPKGWTDGKATEGNNAITKTPVVKPLRQLVMAYSTPSSMVTTSHALDDNIAASAVSLFYIANMMHDITYQYGFTEKTETSKRTTLARVDKAMTLGCLGTAEAGGMGEGWSDALALMILAKSSDTATTGINIAMQPTFLSARDAIVAVTLPTTRVLTSARSSRHLPSVVSAPMPPAAEE
ncbi:hypothetical protein BSLG_010790 [Batrachochytrium salamandrivorans]|nr:hypothetical protein BSLG_010790 [Batrachochytrium salamandrivorans]